jgi:hypothetical protein
LVRLGRALYIEKFEPVSDFMVEVMLSFYVDSCLASKIEGRIATYRETCAVGEEKPRHGVLSCPLFRATQPPWCPCCEGEIFYEITRGVLRYEPAKGLNQSCPIIKEWLGEKNLKSSPF